MHSWIRAPRIGRVRRHRDGPRVQAPEERRDVVQPRGDEEDDAISGFGMLTKTTRDLDRARAQLTEGQSLLFVPVATEEPEDDVVALSRGAIIEQVDQRADPLSACVVLEWFVGAQACDSSDGTAGRALGGRIQPASRYQRYVSLTPCCSGTDSRQPSSSLARPASQTHQRGRASLVLLLLARVCHPVTALTTSPAAPAIASAGSGSCSSSSRRAEAARAISS